MAEQEGGSFSALEGNLTAEQLEEYKHMRQSAAGLVETSFEEPSTDDLDLSALTDLAKIGDNDNPNEELIQIQVEIADPGPGSSTSSPNPALLRTVDPTTSEVHTIDLNSEVTIKYLKGEIAFIDFVEFMKNKFQEKAEEDEGEQEEQEPDVEDMEQEPPEDDVSQSMVEPSTSSQSDAPRKRKKRGKKLHSKLPKDLQGLMGEANLMYARGQHDEAVKMCMEVIRLAPSAPEPYQTLGMLYEELENTEKAMQFYLIGAHMAPSDSGQWCKLAEMGVELGKLREATQYLTKAIKYDPENLTLYYERSGLYRQIGEINMAVDGYQSVLRQLPKSEGEQYFQLARDVTKLQHDHNKTPEAIQIMEKAFDAHPMRVTSEDVNLLVELHMSQSNYQRPLELLIESLGAVLVMDGDQRFRGKDAEKLIQDEEAREKLRRVDVPDEVPIDLRVKMVLCFIHLMMLQAVQSLLSPLFDESPNDMGDLYLDVAEAFIEKRVYKEAKPILATLVHSDAYNLAAVWFIYGECLNALGEIHNAAEAFKQVVERAPQHFGARVSLSAIQQQLGKPEEALRALTQETGKVAEEITGQDMRLLHHKCLLLHSQGKYDEFLDLSKKMLFSHFKDILNPGHMSIILNYRTRKHRSFALRQMLGSGIHERLHVAPCFEGNSALPLDDVWELYLKVCNTLVDQKMFAELEDLAIVALTVPQFMTDDSKAKEAEFLCLLAFILNKNGSYAYNFIKEFCIKEVENTRAWNLFSQAVALSEHQRHNKFLIRLMLKHPENIAISILNAHQSLVCGNYKYALGEYIAAYRNIPREPLISLCIGVTFVQLASVKFAMKRHLLITQACVFLNQYTELRGKCQESYYNLGRAFHQLSLYHASIPYYEKVLETPPSITGEGEMFDLKREAAFNLWLIYKSSNSHEMVHHLMQEYLTV